LHGKLLQTRFTFDQPDQTHFSGNLPRGSLRAPIRSLPINLPPSTRHRAPEQPLSRRTLC
jgi:hypothetical protein